MRTKIPVLANFKTQFMAETVQLIRCAVRNIEYLCRRIKANMVDKFQHPIPVCAVQSLTRLVKDEQRR